MTGTGTGNGKYSISQMTFLSEKNIQFAHKPEGVIQGIRECDQDNRANAYKNYSIILDIVNRHLKNPLYFLSDEAIMRLRYPGKQKCEQER